MEENQRNLILAIVLSIGILMTWEFFYAGPDRKIKQERERARIEEIKKQKAAAAAKKTGEAEEDFTPGVAKIAADEADKAPATFGSRKEALNSSQRVSIDTPNITGSISLQGARIDDLVLKRYKEENTKDSKNVTLLSPFGSPKAYFVFHGWAGAKRLKAPDHKTIWTIEGDAKLTPDNPVTLKYDNGSGLTFRREISVDDGFLFTVKQTVENKSGEAVVLYPFAQVRRYTKPDTVDFFILHEGLVGVMGKDGLTQTTYDTAISDKKTTYSDKTSGWMGITDKYWSTVVIPDQKMKYDASYQGRDSLGKKRFIVDYIGKEGISIAPGKTETVTGHVFAGAKEIDLINKYEAEIKPELFELMIDWGWFDFLTKPLYYALDFFNKFFGNFGLSILFVTVLIKLIMYPLANKSYESMGKMKKLQPEMQRIRDRYKDDKMRQQKELMDMYKKENINPMAGCLPILIQIPVFFALYKVLFITIDMRHAPFFGWITDLSAPDPTNLFNLFGLLPFDPPFPFQVGIWAIIMGLTMFVQMRLNPQQADPVQQAVFNWMPVIFTFMLATFPAGLVIYWAWNNFLSIVQQRHIMLKNDVEVNLIENMGLDKLWNRFKSYTGGGEKNT